MDVLHLKGVTNAHISPASCKVETSVWATMQAETTRCCPEFAFIVAGMMVNGFIFPTVGTPKDLPPQLSDEMVASTVV